jgi:glycosyltransferase involved in cell wall biosynthesis
MTQKCPIIAFAPHPWDEPQWMNRQHILSRLAERGWPVVYNTGALDVWDRNKLAWERSPFFHTFSTQNKVHIHTAGKYLARWEKSTALEKMSIYHYNQSIKKFLKIRDKRFITLLFHPMFYSYAKSLGGKILAFHIYDSYSKQGEWSSSKQLELDNLAMSSDLITASSSGMTSMLPAECQESVRVLSNGVDVALFSNHLVESIPSDLKDIPHPRIIYTGTINSKVDLPLVVSIAKLNPDWHWILLGRIEREELKSDNYNKLAFRDALDTTNIHLLGEKERTEIPRYLANVDVTTMCYRSTGDGWWLDISPLKLHEYLLSGKPVISSQLPTVSQFSNVVDICRTRQQWLSSIQSALSHGGLDTPQERQRVAKENSWDCKVDIYEQWLLNLLED